MEVSEAPTDGADRGGAATAGRDPPGRNDARSTVGVAELSSVLEHDEIPIIFPDGAPNTRRLEVDIGGVETSRSFQLH